MSVTSCLRYLPFAGLLVFFCCQEAPRGETAGYFRTGDPLALPAGEACRCYVASVLNGTGSLSSSCFAGEGGGGSSIVYASYGYADGRIESRFPSVIFGFRRDSCLQAAAAQDSLFEVRPMKLGRVNLSGEADYRDVTRDLVGRYLYAMDVAQPGAEREALPGELPRTSLLQIVRRDSSLVGHILFATHDRETLQALLDRMLKSPLLQHYLARERYFRFRFPVTFYDPEQLVEGS